MHDGQRCIPVGKPDDTVTKEGEIAMDDRSILPQEEELLKYWERLRKMSDCLDWAMGVGLHASKEELEKYMEDNWPGELPWKISDTKQPVYFP